MKLRTSPPRLLRSHIESAISIAWTDFATDHPALSSVIDRKLFYENVVRDLSVDEEFLKAYHDAVAQNANSAQIIDVIELAVRRIVALL
jgi:hypothetical protein